MHFSECIIIKSAALCVAMITFSKFGFSIVIPINILLWFDSVKKFSLPNLFKMLLLISYVSEKRFNS